MYAGYIIVNMNTSFFLNKKILIAVTAGIAAYKVAELVRLLKQYGADVKVMMTDAATEFVGSITFAALSGNRVYRSMFDEDIANAMPHIELAKWAELIMIAPATANIMAELAHGFANNLVTTTCLASKAKTLIAPAMNREMWDNPATQANIKILQQHHKILCGPDVGEQACGDIGFGRMLEPEQLLRCIYRQFVPQYFAAQKILVTAAATREMLDPVRCLTNLSSGKMGFALAEAAYDMGAEVTLISGPSLLTCDRNISRINIESAQEMLQAVMAHIQQQHIFISCAAVADYRPTQTANEKIKKNANTLSIECVKNADILKEVSQLPSHPYLIGFAAETASEKLRDYAKQKLQEKSLDLIVANSVGKNKAFEQEENEVLLLTKNTEQALLKNTKQMIAYQILEFFAKQYLTLV